MIRNPIGLWNVVRINYGFPKILIGKEARSQVLRLEAIIIGINDQVIRRLVFSLVIFLISSAICS